jgi:hypothetical protein
MMPTYEPVNIRVLFDIPSDNQPQAAEEDFNGFLMREACNVQPELMPASHSV